MDVRYRFFFGDEERCYLQDYINVLPKVGDIHLIDQVSDKLKRKLKPYLTFPSEFEVINVEHHPNRMKYFGEEYFIDLLVIE